MKKIFLLIMALFLVSCTSVSVNENKGLKKEIIMKMEKELPGEKFYFIYGIDTDWSISTNIRYRGILYSKRLEELTYPEGLELGMENKKVGGAKISSWVKYYESIFRQIEIDGMVEKKAKTIFGEKTNLINGWSMNEYKYANLKEIIGKKNLTYDEKNGAYNTIVNVFVDDLEKINIEDYKKKTYELSKYIYEYMNYVTSLQIYVRDNSYFENYELVKASIYKPFRDKAEIKEILDKISVGEKINENQKRILVRNFRKGSLDYKKEKFSLYIIRTNKIKDLKELTLEKVIAPKIK